MTDEERSGMVREFKTSLFPEMTIALEEVFEKVY
jgi:hypothetical protein